MVSKIKMCLLAAMMAASVCWGQIFCTSCGVQLSPEMRFCGGCGTPVAGGQSQGGLQQQQLQQLQQMQLQQMQQQLLQQQMLQLQMANPNQIDIDRYSRIRNWGISWTIIGTALLGTGIPFTAVGFGELGIPFIASGGSMFSAGIPLWVVGGIKANR